VLHDRNPLLVKLSDGSIRNRYDIKILNKTYQDKSYSLMLEGIDNVVMRVQGVGQQDVNNLPVFADNIGHFHVFVLADKQTENRRDVMFTLKDNVTGIVDEQESIFVSGRK
jgi:polyferredoxin